MVKYDKLIFELSKEGRNGYRLPDCDIDCIDMQKLYGDKILRKKAPDLPQVSENQVARHYTLLSNKNYGVDTGFYPLGSCTMKYNPKINEDMASLAGFSALHPYQEDQMSQGALELMYNLEGKLGEICGMDAFSLQPAAGSHGELLGLMLIKAYHDKREDFKRTKIIVPDSAHGTNPASAAVCGMEVIEIKSNADGSVNIESLKGALSDEIAGLMLTNPSTLGLFEKGILEIEKLVHEAGGLIYYDGANLNAIMGKARPGDMGFDVVHLNLHKTFSTPHGGGGPGAGPVGCKEFLREFLPVPAVEKENDTFKMVYDKPYSVGKVKGFYGNFGILVRAYTYIMTMGAEGLRHASEMAVLNANYMQERLKEHYYLPIDTVCKHEFVLGGMSKTPGEVTTLDVAKRLLDYGYHPPTVYFPLIISEAMMVEPTETESKETMDGFIDVLIKIKEEAALDPEILKQAPTTAAVRRIDEVKAARNPILKWERPND